MRAQDIIFQAQSGRPDLAAMNAGLQGKLRLAAALAVYPHSSGVRFSARHLVQLARRAPRELARDIAVTN